MPASDDREQGNAAFPDTPLLEGAMLRGNVPQARAPMPRKWSLSRVCRVLKLSVLHYFTDSPPTFVNAFAPALFLAALLFMRSPFSNCIFDEQEALLANPYVNDATLGWLDAFKRDFWGLLPTRSIGSYRPLPNLIWRLLWPLGNSPWLLHWVNVVIHAACAALVASFVWSVTERRLISWITGAVYVCFALLTEAVSGVVGLADVLGALFLVLALHSLTLPFWAMVPAVFGSVLLGLFSKESALVCIPLVAASALFLSRPLHPKRPQAVLRAIMAFVAAAAALVLYTELRKRWFPVELSAELKNLVDAGAPAPVRALHAFLRWFRQPKLPNDPMNNPLAAADVPYRIAGALRIYASGLGQLLVPLRLSGDYSFPAELPPKVLIFPASVTGAFLLVVPPLVSLVGWCVVAIAGIRTRGTELYRVGRLVLLGFLWVPVAYFPHSNIPTVLPTVRAERFWVIPAIGAAFVLGPLVEWLLVTARGTRRKWTLGIVGAWLAFQNRSGTASCSRLHRRPRILESDRARRSEQRQGAIEPRRHARRATTHERATR
ncbi:MAG: hypothetical protein QM784_16290 [Polyangiaceae bacterium]